MATEFIELVGRMLMQSRLIDALFAYLEKADPGVCAGLARINRHAMHEEAGDFDNRELVDEMVRRAHKLANGNR